MITIVNYGLGNLSSIKNMFKHVGVKDVIISSEKDKTARGVFRLLFKNHYREFPKSWLSSCKEYFPKMSENNRQKKLGRWNSALLEAGIKNKLR